MSKTELLETEEERLARMIKSLGKDGLSIRLISKDPNLNNNAMLVNADENEDRFIVVTGSFNIRYINSRELLACWKLEGTCTTDRWLDAASCGIIRVQDLIEGFRKDSQTWR